MFDFDCLIPNRAPASVDVDYERICSEARAGHASPIDSYYQGVEHLLACSVKDDIRSDEEILKLLLLGALSNVEQYFRSVLTPLPGLCPRSRWHADDQGLTYGSVGYYGRSGLGAALLENQSFASAAEIKKATKKITGFDLKDNSDAGVAINSFSRVCHLRHAAVHSRGQLGSRNCRELGLESPVVREVVLTTWEFQKLVGVCHNVVRAYNAFLFRQIVERWIDGCHLNGDWLDDRKLFEPAFRHFYSSKDGEGSGTAYPTYLLVQGPAKQSYVAQRQGKPSP